jgi:hypothetical protein
MTLGVIWIVVSVQSGFQEFGSLEGRRVYYMKLHDRFAEDINSEIAELLFPIHQPKKSVEKVEEKTSDKSIEKTSAKAVPPAAVAKNEATKKPAEPETVIIQEIDPNQSFIFGSLNKQFSMEGSLIPTLISSCCSCGWTAICWPVG